MTIEGSFRVCDCYICLCTQLCHVGFDLHFISTKFEPDFSIWIACLSVQWKKLDLFWILILKKLRTNLQIQIIKEQTNMESRVKNKFNMVYVK